MSEQATEQKGPGLIRSTVMWDQSDANALYMLIMFESEEKAREREGDPRREQAPKEARATMAKIFEGAPEFTDLVAAAQYAGSEADSSRSCLEVPPGTKPSSPPAS